MTTKRLSVPVSFSALIEKPGSLTAKAAAL
jgi:hypothetical protein